MAWLRAFTVLSALAVAAPVGAVSLFPDAYKTAFSAEGGLVGGVWVPPMEHGRIQVASTTVCDAASATAACLNTAKSYTPAFSDCGVAPSELSGKIQNPFPAFDAGPLPATQSILEASSSFFVVPELAGTRASEVTAIWFAFAQTFPTASSDICTLFDSIENGLAPTGAYYEFYRGDIDGSDGWIIPVNTLLVPDGIYGAILRLFGPSGTPADGVVDPLTGGLVALSTAYTYAFVANDPNDENWKPGRTPSGCRNSAGDDICGVKDRTPPWPFVDPGDGDKTTQTRWVISFGERVKNVQVSINGQAKNPDVHDGPCPPAGPATTAGTCADVDAVALFTTSTDQWGTRVVVNQVPSCGDTLTVSAQDLQRNSAVKTVTLTAGVNC